MRVRVIGFEIDTDTAAVKQHDGVSQPLSRDDCDLLIEALEEQAGHMTLSASPPPGYVARAVGMRDLAGELRRAVEDEDARRKRDFEQVAAANDDDDDLSFDAMLAALGQAAVMFAARANQRREERLKARREQRERETMKATEGDQPKETAAQ